MKVHLIMSERGACLSTATMVQMHEVLRRAFGGEWSFPSVEMGSIEMPRIAKKCLNQ